MAATNGQTYNSPMFIAPAPTTQIPSREGVLSRLNDVSSQSAMPFTCKTCARRKVKCDKITPKCSTCQKGDHECIYETPPPRRRKRKLSSDASQRLATYEKILLEHKLLPQELLPTPSTVEFPPESTPVLSSEPEPSRTGKLLAGRGKSRYIDSTFWANLDQDDAMQRLSDDEEEDQTVIGSTTGFPSDPLTGAFMGCHQNLLFHHPSHAEAMLLWKMHSENVEPVCKILHIPTTFEMLKKKSQSPATASKTEECLMFAIYHFAIFSVTEGDCMKDFGQSRASLLQKFNLATRQALVNASFLKSSEVSILQALVLYLMPCRFFYDPHTFVMLTGIAARMSQRMGLHRDGEKFGLSPFDVQMRKRLFFQIIPLEALACTMAGIGMPSIPESWDLKQPLNINDDQIWPGMIEPPKEQKGATQMIFCLARSSVGKVFAKAESSMHTVGSGLYKESKDFEPVISAIESEVEEKYIRYCDIVDPLHFLTIALARSAITAMRMRIRLPKVRDQTITDSERKDLFELSLKILDTDSAAYAHTGLKNFMWHVRSFFAYGSWDSSIFVLTTLRGGDLLTRAQKDAAWDRIEKLYTDHAEILQMKQALQIAIGRLTLTAWRTSPPSDRVSEPAFITALRSMRKVDTPGAKGNKDSREIPMSDSTYTLQALAADGAPNLFGNVSVGTEYNLGGDFDLESANWAFWDQLIQDYQTQGQ